LNHIKSSLNQDQHKWNIKLRKEAVYSDIVELFKCKLRLEISSKDHHIHTFVELFKVIQNELNIYIVFGCLLIIDQNKA
jgi:hypothetical protein